jgi:predicted N-acetyltransferase YhbS
LRFPVLIGSLELDYMAVHPENQGKGIGTALVESGMKQAENMGLDIFVMAFKAGRGVYRRLGFRIEQELVQDDSIYGGPGEYGVYWMIYDQRARSEMQAMEDYGA